MKAILLDRDLTLNEDPGYINNPDDVVLLPGVVPGLRQLQAAGFQFFVFTNQSGIGRGLIREDELEAVNLRLTDLLGEHGIRLEKFYVCPHTDQDECDCRKPKPGLFRRFFADYSISAEACFTVGDRLRDIEAAEPFDVPGILLGVAGRKPLDCPKNLVYCATDMPDAANYILVKGGG